MTSPSRSTPRVPSEQVDDLAMLVRRLAHALRKSAPDHDLPEKALDYLARHSLTASPLREAGRVPSESPPAQQDKNL